MHIAITNAMIFFFERIIFFPPKLKYVMFCVFGVNFLISVTTVSSRRIPQKMSTSAEMIEVKSIRSR